MLVFPFGTCFCGIAFFELENCGRFLTCLYFMLVVAGLAISARSRHFGVGVWFWFLVWNMVIICFLKFALHFLNAFVVEFCHCIFGLDFLLAIGHCRMAIWRVSLFFLFCHHPHNFLPFGFVTNVIDIFVCIGIAVWHVVLLDLLFCGGDSGNLPCIL